MDSLYFFSDEVKHLPISEYILTLLCGEHRTFVSTSYSKNAHLFDMCCQSGTSTIIHADKSMHTMVEAAENNKVRAIDDGISGDADIGKFLTRKVKIGSYTWGPGASFSQTLQPWDLFLSNAAVSNKLANFALFKANMKITVMINGTPFHAGMLLASFDYLNASRPSVTIGGDTQLVTYSQQPHIWLNASTNKSGCICVPFFSPTPFLNLSSPTISASDLGTLHIVSPQDLRQLNAGTDLVTISVFAEMQDVVLTAPTQSVVAISGDTDTDFDLLFTFEVQASKDEYEEDGVISGPASAVAAYAGYFTSIPYIGTLATATQMGASAIGGIARLFGYSKPVNIGDVKFMRNMPISSLALTEGADTSQKLTLTGKQELTIDPGTVGFPGNDDLSMKSFAQRETYLTKFEWEVTDTQNDYIFAIDVSPMLERRTAVTGGTQIIPTSLSFLSRCFAEWSGTIVFRFQVIASQYHRGRIAIIYDPIGPSGSDPYNTTFNAIIDLEEGRDFSMAVKWQNDRPYLECDSSSTTPMWTESSPAARTVKRANANGVLYVQVVNDLVTPDAVTPATVLVSVKAGDDFELMNPRGDSINAFPYPIVTVAATSETDFDSLFSFECQASNTEVVPTDENSPEGSSVEDITTDVSVFHDEKALIYYGERFTSVRQLLKRYCLWRTIGVSSNTTVATKYIWRMKQYPTTGGYDTTAVDLTGTSIPYWYCSSTYLTYFKYYFAGWRGSIRYKYTPNSVAHNLTVQRATGSNERQEVSTMRPNSQETFTTTQSTAESAYKGLVGSDKSSAGAVMTQCRSQDALEFELPYHVPLRFSKTNAKFNALGENTLANGYPGGDSYVLNLYTAPNHSDEVQLGVNVAAGEDFTFFGVVGAPVLYLATAPPA